MLRLLLKKLVPSWMKQLLLVLCSQYLQQAHRCFGACGWEKRRVLRLSCCWVEQQMLVRQEQLQTEQQQELHAQPQEQQEQRQEQ